MPTRQPGNAARSQTHPCNEPDATPPTKAPILQPKPRRAPHPISSPPIPAASNDLAGGQLARAKGLARELGGPIEVLGWDQREAALEGAVMLINTTSQGMAGERPLDLSLARLPVSTLVSDIIYIPRETPLLAAARERGNPTVNGLGMLLHQARPAFKAWFGIMPEVTPELRAMIEATT